MWSLFLERVTPAHDQPCMIWQSMPTEQVMRLMAAGAHRHFEDIVSGRVAPHFVPVLRRAPLQKISTVRIFGAGWEIDGADDGR